MAQGQHQNQHKGAQGRRQGDEEVAPELILHGAALTVAGGDGGVGNEGQVVAKHGAAYNGAHTEGQIEVRRSGNLHGNGGEQRNGAHAGAHGGGDEAGHHKEHCHGKLGRNQAQHKVGHALSRVSAHHAYKGACRQENKQHGDNVLVPHAGGHNRELFVKAQAPVLEAGHQNGHQKRNDDGDVVKAHGNFQNVLKGQTQT